MKSEFEINIIASKRMPNQEQKFLFEKQLNQEYLIDTPYKFVGPAEISGNYFFIDEKIEMRLILRVPMEFGCDKCGEDFQKILFVDETVVFFDKNSFEKEEIEDEYQFSGNFVDIEQAVKDSIISNIPSKVLCREDCKGVCENCGQNLNLHSCTCKK